jgi:hypothetical protein
MKIRLCHEALMHRESICLCLTYADDFLPAMGSLCKRDVQLFLKRLRFEVWHRWCVRVRFDLIGEYSPEERRPHYHAMVFGWWPVDSERWSRSRAGNQQWISALLTRLWGKGHVTFQSFSDGAAEYCARYQTQKLTGRMEAEQLMRADADGVVGLVEPEFHLCSRRPGIGASFYERYGADVRRCDFVVFDGRRMPVPAYYDKLTGVVDPDLLSELKARRELRALDGRADSTFDRLVVREQVAIAKLRLGKRNGCEHG